MRADLRRSLRAFAGGDAAVVGVVGAVLALAIAVSLYSATVRTGIPVWGADAEREWQARISEAVATLARDTTQAIGAAGVVTGEIPPPPTPRSLDVPLLGKAAPQTPTASIGFSGSCARFNATHTLAAGSVVRDATNAAAGCFIVRQTATYAHPAEYRYEFGGVLRIQGEGATVIQGPRLDLNLTSDSLYRVGLVLPSLEGPAYAAASSRGGVRIELAPASASVDEGVRANAGRLVWTLDTEHPAAWHAWFEAKLDEAKFLASRPSPPPGASAADYTLACVPVTCTTGATGLGRVTLTIEGPRTDKDDLAFSFTYAKYAIRIR